MNAVTGPIEHLLAQAERIETTFDSPDAEGRLVWHRWNAGAAGPPIILLHGGAGSWRHWVRTIPALVRAGRTVLAPDLPGLGESSRPPRPYDPAVVARIVADGVRRILPEPGMSDWVGFSFGAIVAGSIAAQLPETARRLTLVGAGALGVPRAPITMLSVRSLTGPARLAAIRVNLLRLMIAEPAHVDALAIDIQDWQVARARVNSIGFASATTLLDALRQVRCPVAGIWGERDHPAGGRLPERIAALRSVQPMAPVTIIPDAGHWVAYEAADKFNDALLRLHG